MKKEFISYWSPERVTVDTSKMPIPRARFFHESEGTRGKYSEIIIPDDVTYDDLAFFSGRKTKITIETVE